MSALGAISLSAAALVHDLGRPARFANMLRVFKPSSPMSVGSWLLTGYGPVAGAAAVSEMTGILPAAGTAATLGAGLLGPAIATYTAALICDTAVPSWHAGYREMPYVFAGSAASAAGGLGLLATAPGAAEPARKLAVLGAGVELVTKRRLISRLALTHGGGPGGMNWRVPLLARMVVFHQAPPSAPFRSDVEILFSPFRSSASSAFPAGPAAGWSTSAASRWRPSPRRSASISSPHARIQCASAFQRTFTYDSNNHSSAGSG